MIAKWNGARAELKTLGHSNVKVMASNRKAEGVGTNVNRTDERVCQTLEQWCV